MEIKRISNGQMPPANKYILIYLPSRPWADPDDQGGVFWKVAKCVYGISSTERIALSQSTSLIDQMRARTYRPEDEGFANNKKPIILPNSDLLHIMVKQ